MVLVAPTTGGQALLENDSMIFDTLNNLPNYLGLAPGLDAVIEYIMARDIGTLPDGRTPVPGSDAWAEVTALTPQPGEKLSFSCREGHLALVTDLTGSEMFEVSLGDFALQKPAAGAAPAQGSAPTSAAGMLSEGRFALFLAGEPYKTGIKAQGCGKVRQAVFLIPVEQPARD